MLIVSKSSSNLSLAALTFTLRKFFYFSSVSFGHGLRINTPLPSSTCYYFFYSICLTDSFFSQHNFGFFLIITLSSDSSETAASERGTIFDEIGDTKIRFLELESGDISGEAREVLKNFLLS